MTTVKDILRAKGNEVFTIGPRDTVFEALEKMAEHDIGALLVVDGNECLGLISERDYARKVILHGKGSKELPVQEIMSHQVVYVTPHHTVESCMSLMTRYRYRHLPVFEGERLAGLVSIGDVVKTVIEDQRVTIQELGSYVTGSTWARLEGPPGRKS